MIIVAALALNILAILANIRLLRTSKEDDTAFRLPNSIALTATVLLTPVLAAHALGAGVHLAMVTSEIAVAGMIIMIGSFLGVSASLGLLEILTAIMGFGSGPDRTLTRMRGATSTLERARLIAPTLLGFLAIFAGLSAALSFLLTISSMAIIFCVLALGFTGAATHATNRNATRRHRTHSGRVPV